MRLLFTCLGLLLGLGFAAEAASYYEVSGGYRSFPGSASVEVNASYNEKLWSGDVADKPWNYGFWKVSGFAATHGQAGFKIDVYPISIWQLSLQRSITSRFYDTLTLDCVQIECRGLLQRGALKTSLALGYGDFFMIPSYMITDLTLSSDSKDFSTEEDNLVADKSGDQLTTSQLALGYKTNVNRFVLVYKNSQMKLTKDHNTSQYLVWSKSLDKEWNYFVGAGSFSSNHVENGFSMVAGLNWSMGEKLSLF